MSKEIIKKIEEVELNQKKIYDEKMKELNEDFENYKLEKEKEYKEKLEVFKEELKNRLEKEKKEKYFNLEHLVLETEENSKIMEKNFLDKENEILNELENVI